LYACVFISVTFGSVHECHAHRHASIATPSGYLSSAVAARTQVGSASCPWQLVAAPGQRINVTLFSFISASGSTMSPGTGGGASDGIGHIAMAGIDGGSIRGSGPEVCYDVAAIRDASRPPRTVTACSGEQRQRQRHVLLSESNTVSLEFVIRNQQQASGSSSPSSVIQTPNFLIHYQCTYRNDIRILAAWLKDCSSINVLRFCFCNVECLFEFTLQEVVIFTITS
jgi:hypothetical protein